MERSVWGALPPDAVSTADHRGRRRGQEEVGRVGVAIKMSSVTCRTPAETLLAAEVRTVGARVTKALLTVGAFVRLLTYN